MELHKRTKIRTSCKCSPVGDRFASDSIQFTNNTPKATRVCVCETALPLTKQSFQSWAGWESTETGHPGLPTRFGRIIEHNEQRAFSNGIANLNRIWHHMMRDHMARFWSHSQETKEQGAFTVVLQEQLLTCRTTNKLWRKPRDTVCVGRGRAIPDQGVYVHLMCGFVFEGCGIVCNCANQHAMEASTQCGVNVTPRNTLQPCI
jgi:hypothetical protein